jgi:host factor-I protein
MYSPSLLALTACDTVFASSHLCDIPAYVIVLDGGCFCAPFVEGRALSAVGEFHMKDLFESTAVGRAPEAETFTSRKLIRPTLAANGTRAEAPRPEGERRERTNGGSKKGAPPEQTHAENFYYLKQIATKTPVVVVLQDGESVHGVIEWYDRCCIKVTRSGSQSNLLIYKQAIRYIYKESEG